MNPINSLPKWGRIAVYGAVLAVAVDYFLSPALKSTLRP